MTEAYPFDEAMAHLEYRFPGLEFTGAGGACPFQAEGILHGASFYFRFRHNWAELRIQGDNWFQPLYSAGAQFGANEDQGWLDGPDFVAVMTQLIGELEHSTIYWEFEGVKTHNAGRIKAGTPTRYGSWAHTPEEAWQRMHEPSEYLRGKGVDDAKQAEWLAARKMNPQTITVDARVFPNPDPFVKENADAGQG